MSSSKAHDKLRDDIILAVSKERLAVLVPYEVGLFHPYKRPNEVIRMGLVGWSDLIGFLLDGSGRFIGVEVKSGRGVLSSVQENFKSRLEKFNCIFVEGRNPEEVVQEIKNRSLPSSQGAV